MKIVSHKEDKTNLKHKAECKMAKCGRLKIHKKTHGIVKLLVILS